METMRCPKCGKTVQIIEKACPYCGNVFEAPQEETNNDGMIVISRRKKTSIGMFIVILFATLIADFGLAITSAICGIAFKTSIPAVIITICSIFFLMNGFLIVISIVFSIILITSLGNPNPCVIFDKNKKVFVISTLFGKNLEIEQNKYIGMKCNFHTDFMIQFCYFDRNNKRRKKYLGFTYEFGKSVVLASELAASWTCPKCGLLNVGSSKYCPKCGTNKEEN